LHFIPTSSLWLNRVESFFADLMREGEDPSQNPAGPRKGKGSHEGKNLFVVSGFASLPEQNPTHCDHGAHGEDALHCWRIKKEKV